MHEFSSNNQLGIFLAKLSKVQKNIFYALGVIIFFIILYIFFLSPPNNFPVGTTVEIKSGMSLRSVSLLLEREHLIRSRVAFEAFIIIFGQEFHVISANYYFENKLPVWQIAERLGRGRHHMASVVITIPEGFDLNQIADTAAPALPNFNKVRFLEEAKGKEGYLFPDTYFFLTTGSEQEVLELMSENFNKKIAPLLPQIISSGRKEHDIITMASVIEREAKGNADRGVISGILWKRIKIGMPIQVDAAPETYKTKGLPKNPIGNPGLQAIEAAIYPTTSPYFYYLHDKNGSIHYAKTFAEHTKNILKYLK